QTDPVKLHKQQFRQSDDEDFCLKIAKEIIRCKISNSLVVLRRHARHRDLPAFEQAVSELRRIIPTLAVAQTLDQVRGYEGYAANLYFQAIATAIDPDWRFTKRVKRPPTDPINAMLSFGYTLLFYNVFSLLRLHGLNPHVGFLHPIRMGHPALVSDMVEEFRALIVDAVVLNLVLNRRLSPTDFSAQPDTLACRLNDSARRKFIHALEKKMNAGVTHPNSGLKLDYRRCIAHQTRYLASVIRGKEPTYRGIVLK
ncbi:MAG: CRISPR-associated endonuclease Cas1, partial [Planctomycetaceae bacterium]|nr:CRISPR-associated endonuclease Cas1 [Planctomycetaceae bacterium]